MPLQSLLHAATVQNTLRQRVLWFRLHRKCNNARDDWFGHFVWSEEGQKIKNLHILMGGRYAQQI